MYEKEQVHSDGGFDGSEGDGDCGHDGDEGDGSSDGNDSGKGVGDCGDDGGNGGEDDGTDVDGIRLMAMVMMVHNVRSKLTSCLIFL